MLQLLLTFFRLQSVIEPQTPVGQPEAAQMNDGNLCLVIAAFHPGILPCNLQGGTARVHTGGEKHLPWRQMAAKSGLLTIKLLDYDVSHTLSVAEWIIRH